MTFLAKGGRKPASAFAFAYAYAFLGVFGLTTIDICTLCPLESDQGGGQAEEAKYTLSLCIINFMSWTHGGASVINNAFRPLHSRNRLSFLTRSRILFMNFVC